MVDRKECMFCHKIEKLDNDYWLDFPFFNAIYTLLEDGVDGFIDAQKIEAYQHIFGVKIASRDSETIAFDLQITTNGFVSNDVYQVTLKRNNPGFTLNGAILPAPASLDPKTYNFDSVRNSVAKVVSYSNERKKSFDLNCWVDKIPIS